MKRSGLAATHFPGSRDHEPEAQALPPGKPGSTVQDTVGMGSRRQGCAPEGLPEAGTTGRAGRSRPVRGVWVAGVYSPHRRSDEGEGRAVEFPSFCPAQVPGYKAAEWCLGIMTPSRASQVGQETADTYDRAWRTRGAPHARRTLQRKPTEMEGEAQAPRSPRVSAAFLPARPPTT